MIDTQNLINKILPFKPQKIILFGSYAKGNPTPESDVDVLIIKKTEKKPAKRIAEVLSLVWGNVPHIEPQILTPEEFDKAIADNRFFITQEVLKHGKVIYEEKK